MKADTIILFIFIPFTTFLSIVITLVRFARSNLGKGVSLPFSPSRVRRILISGENGIFRHFYHDRHFHHDGEYGNFSPFCHDGHENDETDKKLLPWRKSTIFLTNG
jgi:hypothetical protein